MPETSLTNSNKICLECGEPLGAGRDDRKYCSDICRTAFNNRRRKLPAPVPRVTPSFENNRFKKIHEIILRNREILFYCELYMGAKLSLRDLIGKGFNLKFFTSIYQDKVLGNFYFCFDYGYQVIKDDEVYIIERPEETFC